MEIRVDFSELWKHVKRVNSKVISFDWDAVEKLDPIDIELLGGKEIKLADLNIVNGLLSVHGRQVLLYIPDQYSAVDVIQTSPDKGKRFHVADCKTLDEMRSKGRFERYVVTNDLGGVFKITGKNSRGTRDEVESRLLVCRNCLEKLNYRNYCHEGSRHQIWVRFSIAEFFETYSTIFKNVPKRLSKSMGSTDYAPEWNEISAGVRQRCKFICDECTVDLSSHRHLLHVHHINGVKSDNSGSNLRPLCADCHRKQPMHDHIFISSGDMMVINRLRNEQGIAGDSWSRIMDLSDLALHGALMHARQVGFAVPRLGYGFTSDKGVVFAEADVAWPDRRIAICTADSPKVPAWTVVDPVEFIQRFMAK